MHPNSVMLAVVLLGNLMLPFASAQNGKDTDVTVAEMFSVRWGKVICLVLRTPVWNVSKEDLISPALSDYFHFTLLHNKARVTTFDLCRWQQKVQEKFNEVWHFFSSSGYFLNRVGMVDKLKRNKQKKPVFEF